VQYGNSVSGPLHLVELKWVSGFAGYNYEHILRVKSMKQ